MGITNAQRAAIGNHYIAEIKARIATRTKAKDRSTEQVPENDDTDGPPSTDAVIKAAAGRIAKRLGQKGEPNVWTANAWVKSEHRRGFWMEVGGHYVFISDSMVPELAKAKAKAAAVAKIKADLCTEIEFLTTKALAPSTVAAFQAHAARLTSAHASEVIGSNAIRNLIDDFLVSKRGFTCSLK